MKKVLRLLILALLVLLLAGCGTYQELSDKERINAVLKQYAKTARWGMLENLYGFMKAEDLEAMTPADNLGNIKVTDYRVITPARKVDEPGEGEEEVVTFTLLQVVAIEYIVQDAQVVHTLTDNQVWEYNREEKTIYRVNPIPEFK